MTRKGVWRRLYSPSNRLSQGAQGKQPSLPINRQPDRLTNVPPDHQ